jgi:GNAT superfamily N-acetyltransferase
MEWQKEQYTISNDKSKLDVGMIHHYLYTTAYWAIGRPMSVVRKSIENSLCFGLFDGADQVGFARVVTDMATFGYVCDVFVLPSYRGRGLGKWLVECVTEHPDVKALRRVLLSARDAQELYAKYGGFQPMLFPNNWMEKFTDTYSNKTKPSIEAGSKKPAK